MVFRLWTRLVCGLVLGLAAMLLGAVAPAQQPAGQRIVAVGDLHGDYSAWIDIARGAGLIDGRGRWAGGRTTLVQLGDVPDRFNGPVPSETVGEGIRSLNFQPRRGQNHSVAQKRDRRALQNSAIDPSPRTSSFIARRRDGHC